MSSHEGHRARLKERFLKEGLDSFNTHEVVELMLYYAIPQRDVNETAHLLVERFGSLSGILEADIDDLTEVDGVGAHAATMFKLICAVTRRYAVERGSAELRYTSIGQIGKYLVGLYIGVTVERAYILLFDNSMKLLDVINAGEGVINSVNITPRFVIEKVLKRGASVVVLAHNHPNGVATPSREDIALTMQLRQLLDVCGITLLEHFIVSGNYYNVVLGLNERKLNSPDMAQLDIEKFYCDLSESTNKAEGAAYDTYHYRVAGYQNEFPEISAEERNIVPGASACGF